MRSLIQRHRAISVLILMFACVTAYASMSVLSIFITGLYATILMDLAVAGISVLYIYKGGLSRGKRMGLRAVPVGLCLFAALGIFVSMSLIANLVYTLAGDAAFDKYNEQHAVMSAASQLLSVLVTVVLAPVAEELLFRGGIYGGLRDTRLGMVGAAVASAFLFAIMHGTLVHILPATVTGLFCCAVYEYTGNIAYNILVHMFYNWFSYTASGIQVPDWLGSVPAVVIQCIMWVTAAFIIMLKAKERNEATKDG